MEYLFQMAQEWIMDIPSLYKTMDISDLIPGQKFWFSFCRKMTIVT